MPYYSYVILYLLLFLSSSILAESYLYTPKSTENYQLYIDLQQVTASKKVKVTLLPPKIREEVAVFVIPTTSFGGYHKTAIKQLIEGFSAYDKEGYKLPAEFISDNQIAIGYAQNLVKIEYWVNDASTKNKHYFQSGAKNIRPNENFILNHNGFYGFIQDYTSYPFTLTVSKPALLYGACALTHREQPNDTTDIFHTHDYYELFESPILYAKADTLSYRVGKTNIHIATYSETANMTAQKAKRMLAPLTQHLSDFMGGIPVADYHFIMYFAEKEKEVTNLAQYGGLMCGASSFYVLPELKHHYKMERLVRRIAAHEFLHLLTPHQLYNDKIKHAGFGNTEMSKHLWLYEGVTEYFSLLALVQNEMIKPSYFFREMAKKIKVMKANPPTSLTEMSTRIFKKKNQALYRNIYNRGSVIAFLLDIQIRHYSQGKQGLQDVIVQLAKQYGTNKSFDDDLLFDEIAAMTHPDIRLFFKKYVEGRKTIPYNNYFNLIGLSFFEELMEPAGTFGKFSLWPDYKAGTVGFYKVRNNNLGLQNGDIVVAINDIKIKTGNFSDFKQLLYRPEPDAKVKIDLIRAGKSLTIKEQAQNRNVLYEYVFRTMTKEKSLLTLRKQLLKRSDE